MKFKNYIILFFFISINCFNFKNHFKKNIYKYLFIGSFVFLSKKYINNLNKKKYNTFISNLIITLKLQNCKVEDFDFKNEKENFQKEINNYLIFNEDDVTQNQKKALNFFNQFMTDLNKMKNIPPASKKNITELLIFHVIPIYFLDKKTFENKKNQDNNFDFIDFIEQNSINGENLINNKNEEDDNLNKANNIKSENKKKLKDILKQYNINILNEEEENRYLDIFVLKTITFDKIKHKSLIEKVNLHICLGCNYNSYKKYLYNYNIFAFNFIFYKFKKININYYNYLLNIYKEMFILK